MGKALSLAALFLGLVPAAFGQVELLYVTAADCGFCRRWEAGYLEGRAPKASLDWAAGRESMRGTPWFALFVNGEIRAAGFGIHAFETRIQPATRTALREKAGA